MYAHYKPLRPKLYKTVQIMIVAQSLSMAPSADEAYVHEHCKVLPGLPIVLDTPGLVEEVAHAEHLFA